MRAPHPNETSLIIFFVAGLSGNGKPGPFFRCRLPRQPATSSSRPSPPRPCRQRSRRIWFLHKARDPLSESRHRLGLAVAAGGDHQQIGADLAQFLKRLLAAHDRHRHIQQHQPRSRPPSSGRFPRRALRPPPAPPDIRTSPATLWRRGAPVPRRPPPGSCRPRAIRRLRAHGLRLHLLRRPPPETAPGTSCPGLARCARSPRPVAAHDAQHRRQPQPAAGELGGEERIEDPGQRGRIHAAAAVAHFQRHVAARLADRRRT